MDHIIFSINKNCFSHFIKVSSKDIMERYTYDKSELKQARSITRDLGIKITINLIIPRTEMKKMIYLHNNSQIIYIPTLRGEKFAGHENISSNHSKIERTL